jgi:dolichol-phosphate mannosyltransferase
VTKVCRAEVGPTHYEVILVDDGSSDQTWERIAEIVQRDAHVVGVALSRNHGHQLALSAGLTICRGERILIIDADLQDPPELLPEMMRRMDEGADVVFGQRISREGERWFKTFAAKQFYRIFRNLVDFDVPLDTGDFRLISSRVLRLLNDMPEQHRFIRAMVSWTGFKQVAVTYERQVRHAGETKYPLSKLLRMAFDGITGFSICPLRLASYLGMTFGVLGIAVLVFTMTAWMMSWTVAGWGSIITVVLLLGSAQLVVLGVIGEYLGRLCLESKRRPLFVIDRIERKPFPSLPPHVDQAACEG